MKHSASCQLSHRKSVTEMKFSRIWPLMAQNCFCEGTHKSSLGVLCENAKCELTIPPTCQLAWELLLTQRKRKREVGGERMVTFLL